MAQTEVGICNSALIKLGVGTITALTDNTRQAKIMNEQYAKMRDALLYDHPWNFAMKRATVSADDALEPDFDEFLYGAELPADCLRVWNSYYADEFYQIENGVIYSDSEDLDIKYIAKITDPTMFSPAFCEALALKLAADCCYALTQSNSLKNTYLAEMAAYLPSARGADAQENPPYDFQQDLWLNSRI
jgi:hypothetical protein